MKPPILNDEPDVEDGAGLSSCRNSIEYSAMTNETSSLLRNHNDTHSRRYGSEYKDTLSKARRFLYLSHLLSQFSEVAWQFCLILFLAAFCNYKSLILVSSYGLVSNGSVVFLGAQAGRFVDGANRLFVARRFILSENLCVVVASICCYWLLARTHSHDTETIDSGFMMAHHASSTNQWLAHRLDGIPLDPVSIGLLLAIHILGAIAMILDKGFLVAMERDWIVVMSQYAGDYSDATNSNSQGTSNDKQSTSGATPAATSKAWLSETNVTMKQIDLSSKVAAPALAGFLIAAMDKADPNSEQHGSDLRSAAIMVGAINAVALIVEYICTAQIYNMLPALAIKESQVPQEASTSDSAAPEQARQSCQAKLFGKHSSCYTWFLPESMQIYLDQSISMAGVSLSLLYLNVLTFGGIMTAYLVWRGMKMDTVGVWRGVSSAVGLLGTVVYHVSAKRFDLFQTASWSILYQFLFLSMSYVSLFIDNYTLSLTLLIIGVCCSRIGLWVFDIAVNQLMQEYIPDGVRGVVGGVQQSLNSFFFLLSFGLGIIFPDPSEFFIYVGAGYTGVGVALVLYWFCIFLRRDSLTPTL